VYLPVASFWTGNSCVVVSMMVSPSLIPIPFKAESGTKNGELSSVWYGVIALINLSGNGSSR